ncbi:MAG: hypothetical protein B5M53_01110 [Candidatus Cloacimonas sp. 4484_209]|nr:MAG: hypothetical protein B5M53_01110 [Candidatus Cloacimonas sp. 4484_209]
MKILFITNNFPFPPRNGVELPLAKNAEALSKRGHRIYFCLVYEDKVDIVDINRIQEKPDFVKGCFLVQAIKISKAKKILNEITLRNLAYYQGHYNIEQMKRAFSDLKFDLLWASPDGLAGFCEVYKTLFYSGAISLIGINELYYRNLLAQIRLKVGIFGILKSLLRIPFVYLLEKKMYRRADIVAVQTDVERLAAEKMLQNCSTKVITLPNGYKEELLKISPDFSSQNILFMTTVSREGELIWFLKNCWLEIKKRMPGASLLIVGETSEGLKKRYSVMPGINWLGFVDDLPSVMSRVALCIIATNKNVGLINRVVDALAAGVPVLGFQRALETVNGFRPGVHGETFRNKEELIEKTVNLALNIPRLKELSENGRKFVVSINSWSNNAERVESLVKNIKKTAMTQ